jgi:phosphomannomutase
VPAIKKRSLKVVLDSVHGAGGPAAEMLLDRLGVHCTAIAAEPHGRFQHPPEPTRDNLQQLCAAVREHQADLGLAQDPDADRLALVDERGTYIGEEYTLALAADHVLQQAAARQTSEALTLTVAANLSTSRMIDDVADRLGATVIRTPVGEANVAAAMRRSGALIGGEGNGGVIWPRVAYVRDSVGGIGLILELLAMRQATLSQLVDQTPAYAIVKDKLPVDADMVRQLAKQLPATFADARVDGQDGVRLDWDDCWVHVRASNTEPILRIIAEAPDQAKAQRLVARVREAIAIRT